MNYKDEYCYKVAYIKKLKKKNNVITMWSDFTVIVML
jgi:hypothetical protein